jgi:ABC-type phosphate transport system substrate-binding protein
VVNVIGPMQRCVARAFARPLGYLAVLLALLASAPLRPSTLSSQAAIALVVITNAAVPEHGLDEDALRAVFLRKRLSWSNGQHVVPLNYPAGHPLRVTFDRTVLGFGSEQSARYWIDARIRYGTLAPRTMAVESILVRVVTQLPGSISYVPAGNTLSGVRVVARIEAGRVVAP